MKTNLIIFVVVFVIAILIMQTSDIPSKSGVPESGKAKRILCQQKMTSFERGFGDELIKKAQNQLENGNYKFSSYVEKSKYVPSKLFDFVKLSDMDEVTSNILKENVKQNKPDDEKLRISYYIYENDVGDPGKKTKKSKLYAGYVVYKFYNTNNKLLYQSQIDFMNKQGDDIPASIQCAIESFVTFNK
ncbi:MAG: hypothetical protein U9N59_07870 [Campylobacterota bacterium]|nr:hypothetical protein [Campylobacterota bacterium]